MSKISMDEFLAEFDQMETINLPPNTKIMIDPTKCTSCGLCTEVCPFDLPQATDKRVYQIKDQSKCIECTACYKNCPTHAIIMEIVRGCGCLWDIIGRNKEESGKTCK